MSAPADPPWRRVLALADRWIFPAGSVLLVAAWMHGLQFLGVRDVLRSDLLAHVALLPALAFEVWAVRRMDARRGAAGWGTRLRTALVLLWWYVVFRRWVLWGVHWREEPLVVFYGQQWWVMVGLVWRGMGWMAAPAVLLWAGAHGLLTLRWHHLRVFTVAGMPVLLSFLHFLHFFAFGGPGGRSTQAVLRQPGVELLLDRERLQEALDDSDPSSWIWLDEPFADTEPGERPRVVWQARDLVVTEEAVVVMFGCTFCVIDPDDAPMAVRIDRGSGELRMLMGARNLRQVEADAEHLWITPWVHRPEQERSLVALDLDDLSVDRVIDAQSPVHWVPMAVLPGTFGRRLFVATEVPPTVHRYDKGAGHQQEVLSIEGDYTLKGGTLHGLQQSARTGRLYGLALPGDHDVVELSPEPLAVLRSVDLGAPFLTGSALDDAGQKLYVQDGTSPRLWRIDLASMEVDNTYRGELHARKLVFDADRRRLYVLGYLTGRLAALDVQTGERVWELAVGGRGHGLRQRGDELFVHTMAGTFVVDLRGR